MNVDSVITAVRSWEADDAKGLLFVHRTVTGEMKVWAKHVVKLDELTEDLAAAAFFLIDQLGAKNLEIKTKEGRADRIEFTTFYKGGRHG